VVKVGRSEKFALWTTVGYLVLATLWILASDRLLAALGTTFQNTGTYQIAKSLVFIAGTAALLFVLLRRASALSNSTPVEGRRPVGSPSRMIDGGMKIPLIGATVLVVLVVSAVGLELEDDYREVLGNARQENTNLARSVGGEAGQAISNVDLALRSIAGAENRLPQGPQYTETLRKVLGERALAIQEVLGVFILDREGKLMLASEETSITGVSFADREFFTTLRDNPAADLYIGALTVSRIDGQTFLPIARRTTDAHGAFTGVVAARINPKFFQRHFEELDLGVDGVVSLLQPNGALVASSPASIPGVAPSAFHNSALTMGSSGGGSFDSDSEFDGRPRIYGFYHLREVPLTVLVGRGRATVLEPWRALVRNALTALAVFVALVLALALLLQRQARRQSGLIEDLRVSETRFLSFLGNTPAMAWITDGNGRVIYGNQAFARLVDRHEEELTGQPLDELLRIESELSHSARIGNVLTRLSNFESIDVVPGPNPTELLIQYFPLGEANGEHRVGGIALDVTKQRAAEQALALHDRVLRSSPHGVSIASVADDMPLIYVNPAFERITGYSAAEILGRNCRFLQAADRDQDGLIEMRSALIDQRETDVITLRNYRKDGTLFWNETRIAPVRDARGVVTHYVGTLVDVTERKNAEDQLAFHSSHDLLTRLPNRNRFEELLQQEINTATMNQSMLAVAFIDLDHFQQCNDSMGRGGGDLLLRKAGERLERLSTISNTVGRVGGDEFALLIADQPNEKGVRDILDSLITSFKPPIRIGELDVSLSLSAGVAVFPRDGDTVQALLKNAELAMDHAKVNGGGSVSWFQPDMDRRAAERFALENRLRHALARNELVLHYQPQVDAHTGSVIGIEALMRWQDPLHGLIPPGAFIQLAEDTGLIISMGEWAMREACRQNRAWQLSGVTNVPIAVNVSIAQFRQPGFPVMVRHVLEDTGLAPRDLEIEITESLVMNDPELFIDTLRQLKRLGVMISIDDFGTGYSSLNYLKRLPIDKLKIDRSFVGDITHDPDNAALCRSIVDIAHSLRLLAIAEGVETAAQAHFLSRHHCDQLQGFLFCKPLPAAEVESHLLESFAIPTPEKLHFGTTSTILIIDDDLESADALANAIASPHIKIKMARTAAEAFEALADEQMAIVIADYRMPDMNGVALLERVKLLYPETIRMIVTAYPAYESAADAINLAGIFKFVAKPWDPATLRADIRSALEFHVRLADDLRLRDTLDYSRGFIARRAAK
jgi:diguanylate cyclase (GGDEF)-like protein/PAS domain S-box-containing protein